MSKGLPVWDGIAIKVDTIPPIKKRVNASSALNRGPRRTDLDDLVAMCRESPGTIYVIPAWDHDPSWAANDDTAKIAPGSGFRSRGIHCVNRGGRIYVWVPPPTTD